MRHFDILAPIYDVLVRPPDPVKWTDRLGLPTSGSMLDCGGGTGRVSHRLRTLVGPVVIADLSFPMLRKAKSKTGLRPVQALAEALPFPDGRFDRVLVVDALHHFYDPRQAVSEIARVLKQGGRMIIEEPDINHPLVRVASLVEKAALMRSRFFSPQDIRAMIEACGLPARIERTTSFAAWIIADKTRA
ncbi:MAG: class I SAM-dependent methyltransferase [Deltaproteobacteria bacterium]